ncbi:MAG: formylglycine-generating enzyme family protein [Planctomycetota bacterium]|jgi:formylglycine-generating enzyme required for sulfatase activity
MNDEHHRIGGFPATAIALAVLSITLVVVAGLVMPPQGKPSPPFETVRHTEARPETLRPVHIDPSEQPEGAPADLGQMVLVPEGWFIMGSNSGKPFERPAHRVYLDTYFMDIYEVTNFEYREFVRATDAKTPPHWRDGTYRNGRDLHPVTNVSWEEASAYAKWAGKRLPTEAEWEKACRGPDGRTYAYGDEFDVSCTNNSDARICDTVTVDSFQEALSYYGCYNMTGNVWEWVSDWFSTTYYSEGQRNPKGPPSGSLRVSKGGSWTTDAVSCSATFRCRSDPGSRWGYTGFRCARDAERKDEIEPPGLESMILIPEGSFLMGDDDYHWEKPRREIHIDAYWIDRLPVTHEEYFDFCRATDYPPPMHWHAGNFPHGKGNHPVNNVSLADARAFAAWAGKRLPTEAEWEKAARGTDGRAYPWGDTYDRSLCNCDGSKIGHTVPVGSYPDGASPYGVLDMCGNVWEWVEGAWDPKVYATQPDRNPQPPVERLMDVLRGGTWSTLPLNCRTFSRCPALEGARMGYCGFRCVKSAK